MEHLKFCINCKHFTQPNPACRAPQNIKTDLVLGISRPRLDPIYMRAGGGGCGEAALWFEERTA